MVLPNVNASFGETVTAAAPVAVVFMNVRRLESMLIKVKRNEGSKNA
jgi:hypothetical protein